MRSLLRPEESRTPLDGGATRGGESGFGTGPRVERPVVLDAISAQPVSRFAILSCHQPRVPSMIFTPPAAIMDSVSLASALPEVLALFATVPARMMVGPV
jgi:hypothetical protein